MEELKKNKKEIKKGCVFKINIDENDNFCYTICKKK